MSSANQRNYDKLRLKAANAKSYVLMCWNQHCTSHYTNPTTKWQTNPDKAWLLHLSCSVCGNKWSICCICTNFKVALKNDRQILQHYHAYHHETKPVRKRKSYAPEIDLDDKTSSDRLDNNNFVQQTDDNVIIDSNNDICLSIANDAHEGADKMDELTTNDGSIHLNDLVGNEVTVSMISENQLSFSIISKFGKTNVILV
jgi:hypothetical protein